MKMADEMDPSFLLAGMPIKAEHHPLAPLPLQ